MTEAVPPQTGKLAVITGATGGLGFENALALARAGAFVVLAGRNEAKGRAAIKRINAQCPQAAAQFRRLDLASLASVEAFAQGLKQDYKRLDILINNAGLMAPAQRQTTVDGFELQLGTNYLGHFALTLSLLPLLKGARVVSLSSLAHKLGRIDLKDLQGKKRYQPWRAYGQSKLAMLMFALELHRRSERNGWGLVSVAAHPGWARTDLVANGPGTGGFMGLGMRLAAPFFSQSAEEGSRPSLHAAIAPEVNGGDYWGPDGFLELKGRPARAAMTAAARDTAVAADLWEASERLTGVTAIPLAR